MNDYYDKDGNPITMDEWGRLNGDMEYRRIGLDDVTGHLVSTVWLGLNHQYGVGPPLIFETMVFPATDGTVTDWMEVDAERYSTQAEAEAGHAAVVERFS